MEAAMITENLKTTAPKWFTGKALANLLALLPALAESEVQGFWVPGISRKVHAALGKISTPVKNTGKLAWRWYGEICNDKTYGTPAYKAGQAWSAISFIQYGHTNSILDAVKIVEEFGEPTPEQKTALATAREFVTDLAPARALLVKLDATRPKPVFTSLGLSPTVTATLTEQLKLEVKTVRLPEFKDEWREQIIRGKLVRYPVTIIIWPKGTVHGQSRFATRDSCCHACGHAIRNPYNWVPFVMDDAKGVPHSFWVGRDCAKNVFNVDMKGDAEYANGLASAEVKA